MRHTIPARLVSALPLLLVVSAGRALAQEPGVNVAAPRFAISQVDSALAYHPANLVVEQGDWVRWQPLVATIHTTTSGSACTADGLWSASLSVAFTRQFNDTPATYPYFCIPHCLSFNMVGSVKVTTLIDLRAADSSSVLTLAWTGGASPYRVIRSDNPAFTGANVVNVTASTTATSVTDVAQPDPGKANYYLVVGAF
ncbi:MAG TPA: plastocyanin/azurin family copper-binding protein [Candidatus Polarisedimenticolia bacterium]|nr:plastocyanin/azurin family copper-binding protein [Candidatus Polarisedimenticolia bacterium]